MKVRFQKSPIAINNHVKFTPHILNTRLKKLPKIYQLMEVEGVEGLRKVIKFMFDSVCTEVLCAGHSLKVSLHKTANPLKWEEHRRHLRSFSSL